MCNISDSIVDSVFLSNTCLTLIRWKRSLFHKIVWRYLSGVVDKFIVTYFTFTCGSTYQKIFKIYPFWLSYSKNKIVFTFLKQCTVLADYALFLSRHSQNTSWMFAKHLLPHALWKGRLFISDVCEVSTCQETRCFTLVVEGWYSLHF